MLAAVAVAYIAALAFFPASRLRRPWRTLAWSLCSAAVALSPCLVPLNSPGLRFASALVSIGLLVKLYDVLWVGDLADRRGFLFYLTWLPNGYWLTLRLTPPSRPTTDDWRRLRWSLGQAVLGLALFAAVFAHDWSQAPFVVEHVVKVVASYCALMPLTQLGASGARLTGIAAFDPMRSPAAAETPADFWRRWNRPAQKFFEEYAFFPAGGLRHPKRATLMTFAVSAAVHEYVFGIAAGQLQGWQAMFFLTQGVAVAATIGRRFTRKRRWLAVGLTLAFNLTTSVFFFQSIDQVLPFYSIATFAR